MIIGLISGLATNNHWICFKSLNFFDVFVNNNIQKNLPVETKPTIN